MKHSIKILWYQIFSNVIIKLKGMGDVHPYAPRICKWEANALLLWVFVFRKRLWKLQLDEKGMEDTHIFFSSNKKMVGVRFIDRLFVILLKNTKHIKHIFLPLCDRKTFFIKRTLISLFYCDTNMRLNHLCEHTSQTFNR